MNRKISILAFACMFLCTGVFAHAQVGGYGIPSTYLITNENPESGDIVSFNKAVNTYQLTEVPQDKNMFGVIDEAPVVVFRNGANRLPVVQTGEVLVNVTTVNGDITIGDMITSSSIPGKGAKMASEATGFMLGTALESFGVGTSTASTTVINGNTVEVGTIRVLLNIGPIQTQNIDESANPSTIFVREDRGETETGLETIFRYVTAVLFTLGTVFVVLKTFGPNIGKGVVSIGRNPLAKTSIQAMVVFNIILIISIISVSFIISLLIIFLPI